MAEWSFLTRHAHALLLIALDPDARIRDLAAGLDVTDRTAQGIIRDLVDAGYVTKQRQGRRNRYHIQTNVPLRVPFGRKAAVGNLLQLLGEVEPDPR